MCGDERPPGARPLLTEPEQNHLKADPQNRRDDTGGPTVPPHPASLHLHSTFGVAICPVTRLEELAETPVTLLVAAQTTLLGHGDWRRRATHLAGPRGDRGVHLNCSDVEDYLRHPSGTLD